MSKPLELVSSQSDAIFNVRVTIRNLLVAGVPQVVGYAECYPLREPMANHVRGSFMRTQELVIYGREGEVIHVGADVISRSLIEAKVVNIFDESVIEPEPMPLPVIS